MQLIPESNVPNWATSGSDRWPYAADVRCPYCLRAVTFRLENWQLVSPMHPRAIHARCPGCGTHVTFVWLGVVRTESSVPGDFGLYMHPSAPVERAPISGLADVVEIPEPLRRAYEAAITAFNTGQFVATAVLARRALEGLLKHLLPEETHSRTLYAQLQALPDNFDLRAPILTLADAIRKGGNLGAHFDAEKEPTREIGGELLDLLDYIFEYVLVLPGQIKLFHERVGKAT